MTATTTTLTTTTTTTRDEDKEQGTRTTRDNNDEVEVEVEVSVCVLISGYVKQCSHTLSYQAQALTYDDILVPYPWRLWRYFLKMDFSRVPTKPDIAGPTTPQHRWCLLAT